MVVAAVSGKYWANWLLFLSRDKSNSMIRIDIVIVNYNSTGFLLRCLRSVEDACRGIPTAIYIEDNASVDGVDRVLAAFPQVVLTRNAENLGFGRAVNQALEKGRGEYVVILNPDARVSADFFNKSIEFMEDHPRVGLMGPRILDDDGGLQNSARAFPTPLTAFFGRSSFISRRFPRNPITSRNLLSLQSDGVTPMDVDWVSGACMVVRRNAIHQVGLLDERFFMYWEDTDWCRRMWDGGWKVVYYPQVTICHYVGGSSEKRVYPSVIEFHKSVYKLFNKYLPPALWMLRPLVIGGLAVRLVVVILSQLIGDCMRLDMRGRRTTAPLFPSRSPIRIMRIISRLNVGGPAIHVHLLTRGLDPRQFQSVLVTGRISPQEGDMSYLFDNETQKPVIIPELQREIRPHLDVFAFFKIFHLLIREKPDVVHTHTAKAGFNSRFAIWLFNRFGTRRILSVHTFHGHVFEGYFNLFISRFFFTIEKLLAGTTDRIIAISASQREELVTRYRLAPQNRIRTIELGFDLYPFLTAKTLSGRFRKRIGIPADMPLIGIIGRLVPIKHHELFLESAARLVRLNPNLPVRFLIVGDGERRMILERLARQWGLADHVVFCGWIKDVPAVYADLDVLSLTSINEGTPVSLIESMAASVPVITTNAGGVKDLLGKAQRRHPEGFTLCERGLLCPRNDPDAFTAGLRHLLTEPAAEKAVRVARAKAFVQNRFGQDRLISDISALYRDMIQESALNRNVGI